MNISAYASDLSLNDSPIEIEANKFEYLGDEKTGQVKAFGNVEVSQDNQKIFANFIEYDFAKEVLLAEDKVKIIEKNGYLIESDKIILSDRLTLGSMNNFTIITPDKSIIKGTIAKKEQASIVEVSEGFYTSCKICPKKRTIWSITAKSARLNEITNTMEYNNALMRFYGVPVIYTPFFRHYTSKAERKSGLLSPTYGGSSYLGMAVKAPYYFNIAPNQDATLTPVITKKRGTSLEGEYRYLLPQGEIISSGSISPSNYYTPSANESNPKHNIRYNFQSKSDLAITNSNNIGWNINTTSDKNYRRDFNYGEEDFLTSRIYNHQYEENWFYELQTLSFQNLRPSNDVNQNAINQTPLVLPMFESKYQLFQFADNSKLNIETNLLNIHRYNGLDSNRFSIKNRWEKNILLHNGHDFNFFASIRHDFYQYSYSSNNNTTYTNTANRNTSRSIPETGMKWSYPLIKTLGKSKIVVTPITNVTLTPSSKYNKNIYSEDSARITELTDSNLFNESQYNGIDLVENSSRVSYGLKTSVYYQNFLDINALFGQMYRHKPQEYSIDNNQDHLSDYVGRLNFDFNQAVSFSYRYKLDKDTFVNKRNELETTLRYNKMYIRTNLLYYKDGLILEEVKNRRELEIETGVNDFKGFSTSVNARKNLSSKKDNHGLYVDPNGFISVGGRLQYLNDCILYQFEVNRDYTKTKDRGTNTTYLFKVLLKNLSY